MHLWLAFICLHVTLRQLRIIFENKALVSHSWRRSLIILWFLFTSSRLEIRYVKFILILILNHAVELHEFMVKLGNLLGILAVIEAWKSFNIKFIDTFNAKFTLDRLHNISALDCGCKLFLWKLAVVILDEGQWSLNNILLHHRIF